MRRRVLVSGLLVIGVGYGLLSLPPHDGFWSLTAAPVLLILGYCGLVPLGLLLRR